MQVVAKVRSDPPGSVDGYKHGRVPREVRHGQLLELAEELFMEKGYGGFSIDDLCRAAGVSRPIVYEHFGSKDGIYVACLRRIRAEFEAALVAAAAGDADLATTVRASAETWFSMIEREPARWSLVYGGATGLVGPLAEQLGRWWLRHRGITRERIVAFYSDFVYASAQHLMGETVLDEA